MNDETVSWSEIRELVRRRLVESSAEAADREARWIVELCSGHDSGEWFEVRDTPAAGQPARQALQMAERRAAGEPLQYVLGSWQFRRLDLMVDPRVLIPRPETETVVEVALAEAHRQGIVSRRRYEARPAATDVAAIAVDLGTGSGAIALSLAAELSGVEVWATDVSEDALSVARANAAGNALGGVRFAAGEWFAALDADLCGRLSLVVSNPPYVSESEFEHLDAGVRDHEPRGALVAGPSGLEDLEQIIAAAGEWLHPGGSIVVEIAPAQDEPLAQYSGEVGLVDVRIELDLADRRRVLVARRPA